MKTIRLVIREVSICQFLNEIEKSINYESDNNGSVLIKDGCFGTVSVVTSCKSSREKKVEYDNRLDKKIIYIDGKDDRYDIGTKITFKYKVDVPTTDKVETVEKTYIVKGYDSVTHILELLTVVSH